MNERPDSGETPEARADAERMRAREAATREILEVISLSRGDEGPVFDAILENATRLCDAPLAFMSIVEEGGARFRVPAHRGATSEMAAVWDTQQVEVSGSPLATARVIRDRAPLHIEDLAATLERQGDPRVEELVRLEGVRTYLVVPLLRGEIAVGTINLYRREVKPFTDAQIALVETFAAQAVIAIENVRQFRAVQAANAELKTRLRREAATAEVLSVISRSRDDDLPVFEVILRDAASLCEARLATLLLVNEANTHLEYIADSGEQLSIFSPGETRWPLDSPLVVNRARAERRVVQVVDLADDDLYRRGDPTRVQIVDVEGVRTMMGVPLLSGDRAIGVLGLHRNEVRAFTADEISLLETFAEQAVIAIENVRQFKALESLNAELGARVEKQVGEIERMGRLKRFLPAAVADRVIDQGSDRLLKSHRALLGVLFCDIRGFTAFCETAEPEETIEVLQTYHEEMGKLIDAHGAGVDLRMGDGVMVLFNDPLPCEDPAGDAVRLAVAMRARMAELSKHWKRLGFGLGFGVGVSLGYATVGMVGSEGRLDYTASGTAINIASRLCDEAEDGEILLSPRASIAVEDTFAVESKGYATLKGIREPIEVFRLCGPAAA